MSLLLLRDGVHRRQAGKRQRTLDVNKRSLVTRSYETTLAKTALARLIGPVLSRPTVSELPAKSRRMSLRKDKLDRSYDDALNASGGGGTATERSETRKKSKKDQTGEQERKVSLFQLVRDHSVVELRDTETAIRLSHDDE